MAEVNIPVLLFGDYPWNRNLRPHPLIPRVRDWADVERRLPEVSALTRNED